MALRSELADFHGQRGNCDDDDDERTGPMVLSRVQHRG
jgi:hypothetical protein